MISTFRRVVLHKHFINLQQSEDVVGQVFLTNDTLLNVNKVTLTDDLIDLISNIGWKGQLSKQDIIKEDFFN